MEGEEEEEVKAREMGWVWVTIDHDHQLKDLPSILPATRGWVPMLLNGLG